MEVVGVAYYSTYYALNLKRRSSSNLFELNSDLYSMASLKIESIKCNFYIFLDFKGKFNYSYAYYEYLIFYKKIMIFCFS